MQRVSGHIKVRPRLSPSVDGSNAGNGEQNENRGASSSGGMGVDGATTVGALFGSLCDDTEDTKIAAHALASSDTVCTLLSSLAQL